MVSPALLYSAQGSKSLFCGEDGPLDTTSFVPSAPVSSSKISLPVLISRVIVASCAALIKSKYFGSDRSPCLASVSLRYTSHSSLRNSKKSWKRGKNEQGCLG